MNSSITDGIKVSVLSEYQQEHSHPLQLHHVFTYKVVIENQSEHTVQLLRRHWYIYDSIGLIKEVEGKGVVGKQPILAPGEDHEYVSGCNLRADIGKMKGIYLMERMDTNEQFKVEIPEFQMIAPCRMN
jgi:ApaG protein